MNDWIVLLHVLGATVWTGGHLVLALTVLPRALRANDARIVADFEHGFEKLGIPALIVQVLTGIHLATIHVGPDWLAFDVPVVRLVWIKLALLALTLAFAAHARLRLVPKLDGTNLRALAWHIAIVTVVSVGFVVVGVAIRTGGVL